MFRLTNLGFVFLFLAGAAVQYNDPDPLRWIAVYVAAALICSLYHLNRLHRYAPVVLGGACLVASLVIGTAIAWDQPLLSSEEARESFGLLLIALWMAVLSFRTP